MAEYRQIHVKMWGQDAWFLDLEPLAKLLFIYLFSNKYASIAGIYELPMKVIVFETGIERVDVETMLTEFRKARKVYYEDGVIWVVNLQKYNRNPSPKVQTRISKDTAAIPNCPLKERFIQYQNGIDTLSIPELELTTEQEHEQEQEPEQEDTGADAPSSPPEEPKTPPPEKPKEQKRQRKRTKLDELKLALEVHFANVTKLARPPTDTVAQRKSAGQLWWGPLTRLVKVCNDDVEHTKRLIDWAVGELDNNGFTVSSPKSILKTATAEQARRERDGTSINGTGAYGEGHFATGMGGPITEADFTEAELAET